MICMNIYHNEHVKRWAMPSSLLLRYIFLVLCINDSWIMIKSSWYVCAAFTFISPSSSACGCPLVSTNTISCPGTAVLALLRGPVNLGDSIREIWKTKQEKDSYKNRLYTGVSVCDLNLLKPLLVSRQTRYHRSITETTTTEMYRLRSLIGCWNFFLAYLICLRYTGTTTVYWYLYY